MITYREIIKKLLIQIEFIFKIELSFNIDYFRNIHSYLKWSCKINPGFLYQTF